MAKKEMTFEQAKEKLDGIVEKSGFTRKAQGFPDIASTCLIGMRDALKR